MEGFNLAPLQGDAPLKVEGVIINAVFNTLIMLLMDFCCCCCFSPMP